MTGKSSAPSPDFILSADWSKNPGGRAVWLASVRKPSIRPLLWRGGSLEALLRYSRSLSRAGKVLVALDAGLGLPEPAWRRLREAVPALHAEQFPDWLAGLDSDGVMAASSRAADWCPARPFLAKPRGMGLNVFLDSLGRDLVTREVDRHANAKCPFVTNVRGFVGATSQSVWAELIPLLANRGWAFWPFDGPVRQALARVPVVLGEFYPARIYQTANPNARRPTKSSRKSRVAWLRSLQRTQWVGAGNVEVSGLEAAIVNEDEFDACAGAAAFLRIALEERSFESAWDDPLAEGGILGLEEALSFEAAWRTQRKQRRAGARE